MFKITVEGETLSDLASNLLLVAKQFETTPAAEAPKPARKAKASPAPQPEAETGAVEDTDGGGDDAALAAELLAPAEPQPEGSKAIVDAGTGAPADTKAKAKDDAPIKMTFDDVKTAAAKLVAKDQAKLAEILKKYDAANLSGVPKDKLGDFASDVMEALA